MQVKMIIMRFGKKQKSIREISKVVGLPKSTVGFILKSQVLTGKLENSKQGGRPRSATLVDEREIICMVEKKPFMSAQQVQNALQDVDVHGSLSTIKRRLHDQNLRGFSTRFNPLAI